VKAARGDTDDSEVVRGAGQQIGDAARVGRRGERGRRAGGASVLHESDNVADIGGVSRVIPTRADVDDVTGAVVDDIDGSRRGSDGVAGSGADGP
jgi:hypothetical protein